MKNKEKELASDSEAGLQPYEAFTSEHPAILSIVDSAIQIQMQRRELEKVTDHEGALSYQDWPKVSDMPGYLGAGYEKSAFLLEGEFVVKVQNLGASSDDFISSPERQVEYLKRGLNIDGLEQIVTANINNGVIVTRRANGRPISEIPSRDLIGKITKEHVAKLETTLSHMVEQGLEFDNPHNVLFDPADGFTVVDYRVPVALRDGLPHSADPSSPDYSPAYEDYLKRHTIGAALDELISSKRVEQKDVFDTTGEQESYLKKSFSRKILKLLLRTGRVAKKGV